MNPSTVLITGGFGYVGSRLTPHLLELGYKVTVLDLCLYGDAGLHAVERDPRFPDWKPRFRFLRNDLRDRDAVRSAVADATAVIHLAAISNDPTGEVDETLTRQVNFDAVAQLLVVAKNAGVRRFINASSSSVYGVKSDLNVTENLEPEPLTFYSRYKMLSEWLVSAASSREFVTTNLRPATICGYSPRQRFDLTVNKLTADAIRKGLITVHGGEQRRPNVGMSDVIRIYSVLLEAEPDLINGQTFNFGFENLKVIEIAQRIQGELADLAPRLEVTKTVDHRDYHISSEKIRERLAYEPISSISREVGELRAALAGGQFPDIDDPVHHNMKSMRLDRRSLYSTELTAR